jgi:glycine/serine hydroxymethyltransferase
MNIQQHYAAIRAEEQRNKQFLHLTSNEPFMPETASTFLNSRIGERYYMGAGDKEGVVDFEPFTTLGLPGIAGLVHDAEEAAKEMLGAAIVNLSCLFGVHAMMCAILSTTEPGDTVMTVHHDHGGHFATKGIVARIGRKQVDTSYNYDTLSFDVEGIAKTFKESGAKAFYMDVSYYLNPHNLREIRAALGEEAIIIYDASHTMGLIMGQQFQSPLKEGANVICANTHKTLPGPQKGMIAFRDAEFGGKANDIINSCLYSSPHTVTTIALATTILEMKEFGQEFAKQIVANSNALAESLAKRGYRLRKANTGRYSENHQVHWFTEGLGDYRQIYRQMTASNINVNFDSPAVFEQGIFIRLGTQEVTRRGMKEAEMDQIAGFLDRGIKGEKFGDEVIEFTAKYQTAAYSFDGSTPDGIGEGNI